MCTRTHMFTPTHKHMGFHVGSRTQPLHYACMQTLAAAHLEAAEMAGPGQAPLLPVLQVSWL